MKQTLDYIEDLKKLKCIESDYAVTKLLGISKQRLSNYRQKKSIMDDDIALKLATILNINPLEIIATANIERAKQKEMKDLWRSLAKKLQSAAMIAGMAVIVGMSPGPNHDATHQKSMYIMLNWIKKIIRAKNLLINNLQKQKGRLKDGFRFISSTMGRSWAI